MKNLIFIILLFSSSLFALNKTVTITVPNAGVKSINSYSLSDCQSLIASVSSSDGDVYNQPYSYSLFCPDHNPNPDLLKYLGDTSTMTHTFDPSCKKLSDTLFNTYIHTNAQITCNFQCKDIPPPDNSGDYIFDEEDCKWVKPCKDKIPDGWIAYPMANNQCIPYKDLSSEQQQIYPPPSSPDGSASMVCNTCVTPPYDKHTCAYPKVLDTSVNPPRCVDSLFSSKLDSDGDGIPNQFDDFDGPGTSNGLPINPNGGPTETTCSSLLNLYLGKCQKPNKLSFSCRTTKTGLPYIVKNSCTLPVDPCDKISDDFILSCKAPKKINGGCTYDFDTGIINNTFTCDTPDPDMSPCEVAYSNLKVICKSPDHIAGNCLDSYGEIIGDNTLHCVHKNSNDSNTSDPGTGSDSGSGTSDSNISSNSTNLYPLIAANNQNTNNLISHVDRIENNTRITNDKLTGIDSKISTMINSTSSNLKSISSKMDISNRLSTDIAGNTASTSNKLNTTNALLDSINDKFDTTGSFQGGVDSVDSSKINIDTKGIDDTSDYIDNLKDNLNYLTKNITSIKSKFTNLKDMLNGDHTHLQLSSGSCSDPNLSKFASIIAPYSAPFAVFTYISTMIMIFKMIFQYLSRGEN